MDQHMEWYKEVLNDSPEYKDISVDMIRGVFEEFYNRVPKERSIKMWTNSYGMDQFQEAIVGKERIYFGTKLPRFIKNNLTIHQSQYTKRYFKWKNQIENEKEK